MSGPGRFPWGWPRFTPQLDRSHVGVTFVDVLFALVVGKILEPFTSHAHIPAVGLVHLVLAFVLTLTSWIGYHTSANLPAFRIRFPNLPLAQFLLDVSMVVTYWMIAVYAEVPSPAGTPSPSALPEAVGVFVAFGLYVLWDEVSQGLRQAAPYRAVLAGEEHKPVERGQGASPAQERWRRRVVTWIAFLLAGVVLLVVIPRRGEGGQTATFVLTVDSILIALIVLFRFGKEAVSDPR
jgi:hypothetical protein